MTIEVFHWKVESEARRDPEVVQTRAQLMMGLNDIAQNMLNDAAKWSEKGLSLVKVADIDATSLDDAFHLTNHIGNDWTLNRAVSVVPGQKCRSTSVGDIMRKDDAFWVVSSAGFTSVKVNPELALALSSVQSSEKRSNQVKSLSSFRS